MTRKVTRNVTVAIPATTHRQARIWALCHNTSLSAIVAYLLQNLDVAVTARCRYDDASRPQR